MEHTYFITGFPGFIATRLVKELKKTYPCASFYLLVLKQEMNLANERIKMHSANIHLVEGDITQIDLGINKQKRDEIIQNVTHCVHLAALYDLTIPYSPAYACNVQGTEHVLKLVKECRQIKRFCYFSTAYVSGNEKGIVLENRLIKPESFRNHYEHTKYLAEQKVQSIKQDIPVTIIRPGIIVGDSITGETAKFDGPYFMMKFLKRLSYLPIPYIGKTESFIHLVPIDFIINASIFLMHDKRGISKTYHLLSPDSPSVQKAYSLICEELNGKRPSWYLPKNAAESVLSFPIISKWFGVPKEVLSYFSHEAYYDTSQLEEDLKGTGIEYPHFEKFIKPIVQYFNENAENLALKRY
ncbi:SDR family oxidoreductase [Bacillus sp. NEB1478]|uniref:SDR family oxidoreductase n=1 Tax=Bacillus sp. NEB1478 TaxID=3073816 RepID=UPI002873B684|nr:SDR family oxidoreductase [Bacillus sp. NEB1478]WNB90220.1 SDR family oxidoreductase [Bacillus sp. NEB1478]